MIQSSHLTVLVVTELSADGSRSVGKVAVVRISLFHDFALHLLSHFHCNTYDSVSKKLYIYVALQLKVVLYLCPLDNLVQLLRGGGLDQFC